MQKGAWKAWSQNAPIVYTSQNGLANPDGFFIQLIQQAPAAGAPEGNVHRVSLAYTMENAKATRAFYSGKLGIELTGSSSYSKDPAMLRLVGAPAGTEFRKLSGVIPGPPASVEFTEFRGVSAHQVSVCAFATRARLRWRSSSMI